jgi:pilus assembly protein Flp/PilA
LTLLNLINKKTQLVSTIFLTRYLTFVEKQKGVTMIEYILIAALIAIAAVVTIKLVGGNINNLFTRIANCMANTGNCS